MTDYQDIESNIRLSDSCLWDKNRTYYARQGVDAWSVGGVPYQVTSNPFVAESFTRLIVSWMRSRSRNTASETTFQLVELGAGTGQLGWSICKSLHKYEGLPSWKYTLTDLSQKNIDTMSNNSRILELSRDVSIETAWFDVEASEPLPIDPGPVVIIATYVFDAIRQDAFEIHNGQLFQTSITLREAIGSPDTLGRLSLLSERTPFTPYPQDDWNHILLGYQDSLDNASILFPTAGLQFLERTIAARKDVLLVACDKGYNHQAELEDAAPPLLTEHGSLSMMVNFDAIGKWTEAQGGLRLHEAPRDVSLVSAAFVFGDSDQLAIQESFKATFGSFAPGDYFDLHAALNFDGEHELPLSALLALLRLGRFDPRLFYRMSDRLIECIPSADPEHLNQLISTAALVLEQVYPIPGTTDLAFPVGLVLYELDQHELAVGAFTASNAWYSDSKEANYNLGLALQALGRTSEAAMAYKRASSLAPGWHEPVDAWKNLVDRSTD